MENILSPAVAKADKINSQIKVVSCYCKGGRYLMQWITCSEWTSNSVIADGKYFVSCYCKGGQDKFSDKVVSCYCKGGRYLVQWIVQALCGWFRKFVIWAGSPLPFVGPGYRFTSKKGGADGVSCVSG